MTTTKVHTGDIDPGSNGFWKTVAGVLTRVTTVAWAEITGAPTAYPPNGSAGGVLSGTYPNPGFAADMATQSELDAALALKAPLASPTFTGTVTVPTPSNSTDASTKAYVDATAQGLSVKQSVRLATAAPLPAVTVVGSTLVAVAVGVLTIDGVAVALNDRILVKDQVAQLQNGLYTCTTVGTGLIAFVLTRAADSDTSAEIVGSFAFVEEGTVNADSGFVNTNTGTITVGTTAITYTQFSGAGAITAGAGLTKTGNTLDVVGTANRIVVAADAVDVGSSVYVAGGTDVAVADGGTGSSTAAAARTALGIDALLPTLYRKNTSKTVVNSVADTDLLNGEITVAANAIGANGIVRLTAFGDWLQNQGAVQAGPRFKLKFGGTTILDSGAPATAVVNSAVRWSWRVTAEIMNLGATNSQFVTLWLDLAIGTGAASTFAAAVPTTGLGRIAAVASVGGNNNHLRYMMTNTAAIDTTASKALVLSVILPATSATVDIVLYGALVEII